MKEKLEAVTGSRKNSVRSSTGSVGKRPELLDIHGIDIEQGAVENGIKKLAENRKLLLEQKLGGGKYHLTFFTY